MNSGGDFQVYVSHDFYYEVLVRFIIIPAIFLFFAYRYIFSIRANERDKRSDDHL